MGFLLFEYLCMICHLVFRYLKVNTVYLRIRLQEIQTFPVNTLSIAETLGSILSHKIRVIHVQILIYYVCNKLWSKIYLVLIKKEIEVQEILFICL